MAYEHFQITKEELEVLLGGRTSGIPWLACHYHNMTSHRRDEQMYGRPLKSQQCSIALLFYFAAPA